MKRLAAIALLLTTSAQAQTVYTVPSLAVQDIIQVVTPASGDTVVSSTGVTVLLINGSSALVVLTVTAPPNPVDGQRWMVASGNAVTLLNIGGGTIKGAATGISINGYARFIYSASAGAWFRTG